MEGTLLASDLGFPEGPVIMPDGSVVFCDGNTGEMRSWKDGELGVHSVTGGSPWGAVLGTDGAIYVTQGGNVPGSGDESAVCGIQRVNPDGSVELLSSEIAGHTLAGPNDLAFGPDGRLWFTDSGTEQDPRAAVPATGKLFVLDANGGGEMLAERPNVYPNGIAFDGQGRMYWTESMAHRRSPLGRRRGDDVLPAQRRPRPGRHGVRGGRPAVRVHDDLRRPDGALARGRGARGDRARPSTRPTASSTARRCT